MINGCLKTSRRRHEPLTIFIGFRQYKSDSPDSQQGDSPISASNDHETQTRASKTPAAAPPTSKPGASHFSDLALAMNASLSVNKTTPSTCSYGTGSNDYPNYSDSKSFLLDPMDLEILSDPFPDFGFSEKTDLENWAPNSQPYPLTPARVNEMTSNEQVLDPDLLLQNRALYSHHTRL